jgi:flagellin
MMSSVIDTNNQALLMYNQLSTVEPPSSDLLQSIAPQALDNNIDLNLNEKLSIQTVFSTQLSDLKAGLDEANRGIEFAQSAQNDLRDTNETLEQMRQLAQKASSEELSSSELEDLNKQFQEMLGTIEPNPDYSSDDEISFDVSQSRPVDFTMQEVDTETLGLNGLDISTPEAAREAMDQINNATTKVNSYEVDLGNLEQELQEVATPLTNVQEQANSDKNPMIKKDTDFAVESANFDKQAVMSQLGSLTVAQSNASPINVFKLLS